MVLQSAMQHCLALVSACWGLMEREQELRKNIVAVTSLLLRVVGFVI
jgi:hypothetical protein